MHHNTFADVLGSGVVGTLVTTIRMNVVHVLAIVE